MGSRYGLGGALPTFAGGDGRLVSASVGGSLAAVGRPGGAWRGAIGSAQGVGWPINILAAPGLLTMHATDAARLAG